MPEHHGGNEGDRTAATPAGTAERIIGAGRHLMMMRGYNGFSYADVADAVGVRKATVHHHFPTKADLAVAVVERSRAAIAVEVAALDEDATDAVAALRGYTDHWERCIADGSAPFCLAAVLGAETPSLPPDVVDAVRAHFGELSAWLSRLLALGRRRGAFGFDAPAEEEAERLIASVYGAMLAARVFGEPDRFERMVEPVVRRLLPVTPAAGPPG